MFLSSSSPEYLSLLLFDSCFPFYLLLLLLRLRLRLRLLLLLLLLLLLSTSPFTSHTNTIALLPPSEDRNPSQTSTQNTP